jgi:hypothetical protein
MSSRDPPSEVPGQDNGSVPAERKHELRTDRLDNLDPTGEIAVRRRLIALLRSGEIVAPARLQCQIEVLAARASSRARSRRRRRVRVAATLAALAGATAVTVALVTGSPQPPTVPQVARLALAEATRPAPRENLADPYELAISVDRLPFPYWQGALGWRAAGARNDVVNGRSITTVYYVDDAGRRLGYSIAAGSALPAPRGTLTRRHGRSFRLVRAGSLRVITWVRVGHTCVLAGASVSADTLVALASRPGSA